MKWRKGRIALAALALLVLLPGVAHAAYAPLATGTATLTLAPPFRALLHEEGIALLAREGALITAGQTATLPVGGGEADSTTKKASWNLQGKLILASSSRKVALTFLRVDTKSTPLLAKVGGGQQKVARAGSASFRREGFGFGYQAKGLRLTEKTATRLDKRLKTKAFNADLLLGSLRLSSQPQTLNVIPQGRATLAIAPAFARQLTSLRASLNPIAPTELGPGPTLSFPILPASTIAPDGGAGTLRLGGEAELLRQEGTESFGQLFWDEPWLELEPSLASIEPNLQPSPPFAGKGARAPLFSLTGTQIALDPRTRTVSLSGMALTVSSQAAQELNETLGAGTSTFAAGEVLGTLAVTVAGE